MDEQRTEGRRVHGGIFSRASIPPPVSRADLPRWLRRAFRAEAANHFDGILLSRATYRAYREWRRLAGRLLFGNDANKERTRNEWTELWRRHGRVLRGFSLLEMAGAAPIQLLPAFQSYGRNQIYPVLLPVWSKAGAETPLPEHAWRLWGPFPSEPYTASLLGGGMKCVVFDQFGINLYEPSKILNARQGRFVSDTINAVRTVIATHPNFEKEPGEGASPVWLTHGVAWRSFAVQMHRVAALVWRHHRDRGRRCACGAMLRRNAGGNPSFTCSKLACRQAYERRRKTLQRIDAHLLQIRAAATFCPE